MPTRKQAKGERTVSITVTLPLGLMNGVDEEADLMGRGFSDAIATLLRIGLDVRRSARIPGGSVR